MSTLEKYIEYMTIELSNTSDIYYTPEMKRKAINDAILQLYEQYDINEFRVVGDLVFVDGKASIPAEFGYMDKLWREAPSGNVLREYVYVDPDQFDQINDNSYAYWTIDYDDVAEEYLFLIKKAESVTLRHRYYKNPTELVNPGDESGLTSRWDNAIAYHATGIVLFAAERKQEAQMYFNEAVKRIKSSVLFTRNQGGIKEHPQIRSKYGRLGYLNRRSR